MSTTGAGQPPDDVPGGTITIDCDLCVMRRTGACADCVVTFLCDRTAAESVLLDLDEQRALRGLARAGLAAELRHRAR